MAGHSKWANIRRHKGAQDAKRGKLFTKLIREITVSARAGGSGDIAANPRLRAAVDKAYGQNMTKDTIERAIKRGTGEIEGAHYEEVSYEGYGPAGVAVYVECQTDNRNRTAGDVRHAFSKHGGNLGQDGSVAYLFKKQGVLSFDAGVSEDKVMEAALDAGADDLVAHADGGIDVLTPPEHFSAVRSALEQAKLVPAHAEVVYRAAIDVKLTGADAEKMLKLLDALEDLDDVQNVYTNADFPDELAERAAG